MPSVTVKNLTSKNISVDVLNLAPGGTGTINANSRGYEGVIANLEAAKAKGYISYVAAGSPGASLDLTPGGLSAGAIQVTGSIVDNQLNKLPGLKNVFLKGMAPTGPVAITVQDGTTTSGGGTSEVWAKTDALGNIAFTVEDGTAGEVALVEVRTEFGTYAVMMLQF